MARYEFAAREVAGKRVVDCACGEGLGIVWCVRAGAGRVIGVDRASAAAAAARRRCGHAGCLIVVADAAALPLPSGWADVYLALETIEHVRDPQAFLREVARVLSGAGTFICSTPNRAVTNPGTSIAQPPRNCFHIREYTPEEFSDTLHDTFEEIALYGQRPTFSLVPFAYDALKLLRCIWDPAASYAVRPVEAGVTPEYLLAVCRRPRHVGTGP